MEGGELFDKVVSIDKYPESTAKLLFYQMACACKVGPSCMSASTVCSQCYVSVIALDIFQTGMMSLR